MIDRELLEKEALAKVCASHYYDLQDYFATTSDQELLDIIERQSPCAECGK